jgi:hypothetical protein
MKSTKIVWEQAGDGWLRYRHPDVQMEIYIRPVELEDRIVIGELRVADDQGVRAGVLKALRLEPIEVAMNRGGIRLMAEAAISRVEAATQILRQSVENKKTYDLAFEPGPGGKYPDKFYREVASFYMDRLEDGRAPAPELAEATGKPVSTVRRWVAEARTRGYLPKGRQGRAG